MNILLFCAAGYSSSMIVNDLKKYCLANDLKYTFTAKMATNFDEALEDDPYDVVLLAPQISYKYDDIRKCTSVPVVEINSMDYALCNVKNIVKLIENSVSKN